MNSSHASPRSKPPSIDRTETITTSYGKGLAATTLISDGSTILSTCNPYHMMPENAVLSSVCSYCLLSPSSSQSSSVPTSLPKLLTQVPVAILKRCAVCRIPHYCSPTCQKADWSASHKSECAILASLPSQLPTPVRAVMQILLRKDRGVPWVRMESHETDFKQDKKLWEDIVLQARAAVMYGGLGEEKLGEAVGLLCRVYLFLNPSYQIFPPKPFPASILTSPR